MINSTSNKIKINIIKKKWIEKGIRNSSLEEKPHSKGLWNSRFQLVFFLSNFPKRLIIKERRNLHNINLNNR